MTTITASIFDFTPLTIEASGHLNEMKFTGCLVTLDGPSSKPPNGSQGKKIWMPSDVARKRLHTLIGMGLNYKPELDGHAPRRKVGVIQKAWIDGKNLMVSGIIWKKDFPEAEQDLKNRKDLGMSFEASDISVEDPNAPMWKLTDFTFTGGTILHKKDAAYFATSAIAAQAAKLDAASQIKKIHGGNSMASKNSSKHAAKKASKTVRASAGSDESKVMNTLIRAVVEQTAAFKTFATSNQLLASRIEASISHDDSDEEIQASAEGIQAESGSMSASAEPKGKLTKVFAKKKAAPMSSSSSSSSSESFSDSMSASADSVSTSLEHLGEEDSDDDDMPGHLNKTVSQKGDKTTVSTDHNNNKTVSASAFKKMQKTLAALSASSTSDKHTIKKLKKQIKANAVQLEAAASRQDRKSSSLSAMAKNIMAKGGIDIEAAEASDYKMSVAEVDGLLASAASDLTVTQRMGIKNELVRAGRMEEGIVSRAN